MGTDFNGRRFGFFTDTHFTNRLKSRKDDYLAALCLKLSDCFEWFDSMGCEFLVFGGDFFDRHREMSWDLIHRIRELIISYDKKIYYIAGNHDIMGYRIKSIGKSNLGFLDLISDGRLVYIDRVIDLDWVNIYASHAGEDVSEISNLVGVSGKPSVMVSHCLLCDSNNKGTVHIDKVTNRNLSLLLSGDLHDGYKFQPNKSGIFCYNPGSLLRKSVVDISRQPKVACFSFEDVMGSYIPVLREYVPEYNNDSAIFNSSDLPKVTVSPVSNADYVDMFKEFKRDSKNIFDILKRIGKETGVKDSIINLISSYEDGLES